MKICKICKIEKPEIEYNSCGGYKDKKYYRKECKPCSSKLYDETNRAGWKVYRESEHGKEVRKAYKQSDAGRESNQRYENNRRKRDNLYKCKRNLRDRLNKALKAKSWKKDTHFSEYIGCSYDDLIFWLEFWFEEGMTWDNYGHGIRKWTIDHSMPLSSAKTEEDMYKLAHYSNLQPMWYIDNIKKSNKI